MLPSGSPSMPSVQGAISSASSIKEGKIRRSSFGSKLSLAKCIGRSLTRQEVYVILHNFHLTVIERTPGVKGGFLCSFTEKRGYREKRRLPEWRMSWLIWYIILHHEILKC